jgi:hypothetical protein
VRHEDREALDAEAARLAVVSKPIAKKTTCRSGWRRARPSASIADVTTRTSPPRARTPRRSLAEPGTRNMSPYEQKITSRREAIAIARSIASMGVTHTGHPGPCSSVTPAGRRSSTPKRAIAWVWPPHTSITAHGRVTSLWIASR